MHLTRSLVVALALACAPSAVLAGEHRLVWEERWPRFRGSEYAYTTATWASYGFVEYVAESPATPRWHGGVGPDAAIRRAVVMPTRKGRAIAGVVSEVLWIGTQVHVWVDALAVPIFLDHWNFGVAAQLALMNEESLGPTALLSRLGHRYVARARPSFEACKRDPTYEPYCEGGKTASFPSGHAAASFAAAGLTCAHHQYLPLYGGGAPDAAACAGMIGAASVGGVLRLMADRHWASDLVVGALLGFAAGYSLPVALHYAADAPERRRAAARPPVISIGAPF